MYVQVVHPLILESLIPSPHHQMPNSNPQLLNLLPRKVHLAILKPIQPRRALSQRHNDIQILLDIQHTGIHAPFKKGIPSLVHKLSHRHGLVPRQVRGLVLFIHDLLERRPGNFPPLGRHFGGDEAAQEGKVVEPSVFCVRGLVFGVVCWVGGRKGKRLVG